MFLFISAFIAGMLTVLAPCVLPLLPVIIGGSISGDTKDKRRPVLIAASLAVSLIVFTLLLKATTLLINIPPAAITYFSGGIIIALGLATLFPRFYVTAIARLGLEHRAQKLLGEGTRNKSQYIGPILTGAALGPVFSSCSPVYGYIIATVLPAHFTTAMAYIVSYVAGLSLLMLAIGYYGQGAIRKLKFASNPNGWFQRALAIVFIIVGLLVFTGTGTRIQTYAADHSLFNFDKISSSLLPKSEHATDNSKLYNVAAYKAPEFAGIKDWINSDPLTMASLKGKVVLVDFWTYSCINCIRSLPYVQGWYSQYEKDGFVVIGVHAPEFAFEKVPANVEAAVKSDKLTYPVALDSDLQTWDAFHNQYWPAEYLIDKNGDVRREHFGEGEYDKTEQAIRGLLAEGSKTTTLSSKLVASGPESAPVDPNQTPETYLGGARASSYAGSPDLSPNPTTYTFPEDLPVNTWSLSGKWTVAADKITANGNSKIRLAYGAKNIYLVAGAGDPNTPVVIDVTAEGKTTRVSVSLSNLYQIAAFKQFSSGTIELSVPDGTDLNTFTFGN